MSSKTNGTVKCLLVFLKLSLNKSHVHPEMPEAILEEQTEDSVERKDDEYTEAIGENGRWQMFLFFMLAFPIKMVLPGIHFGIIFIAPKTAFNCMERFNSTEETANMTCYNDCVKYEYYSDFDDSIITQWNLICDRAWLANLAQTVCMFGALVGSIIFGFISDRYGRRPTILIAGLLETCTAFTMPFCSNYWVFIIVRFFLGAATTGTMITAFVLLMEIFGPSKRELLGCMFMLPLIVGHLLMTVVAFYFRNWRDIGLGAAAPTLVYLTYVLYVPESPKWLISVGRLEEASVVMANAAKWNKLPTDNMLTTVENISKKETTKRKKKKATFVDLIRLSSLRLKTLCSCLTWFIFGVVFYGSTQYFGQSSSNTFLSFAMMGIAQFPVIILSALLSKLLGRRWTIIVIFIISSFGNGLLALPDDWYHVKLIAGTMVVGCGGAVFSLLYVYTPELFPTVARNMAMGIGSTTNRAGSMIAPFIGGLHATAVWIPPAVFAVVPAVAVVAICCLPETKGKQLEDQLEEN